MDTTAPWLQEMALVKPPPMEDQLLTSTTINNNNNMMSSNTKAQQMMERKATRPQKDQTLACPRCNSTNTKFCYYNNYSLTQPRYFCKSCRRYWTEGGSLRNVPVGGGSRKNKRSSSASASASMPLTPPNPNPNKFVEGGQDLNLAFAHQTLPEFRDFNPNHSSSSSSNMMLPTGGVNPNPNPNPNPNRFGPFTTMMPAAYSSSGFSLQQDFRPPALNFPLDGINGGYHDHQNGGRILFDHQSRVQGGDHPPVFWNGMIGGQGGSW